MTPHRLLSVLLFGPSGGLLPSSGVVNFVASRFAQDVINFVESQQGREKSAGKETSILKTFVEAHLVFNFVTPDRLVATRVVNLHLQRRCGAQAAHAHQYASCACGR